MIATLHGTVTQVEPATVIECAGVGYGIIIPRSDSGALHLGSQAKFFIYEHIKEDSHNLFGFSSEDTKSLFERLLGVKNVGPKVAMAVLDVGPLSAVKTAISEGDVKLLQTAKGVGKRAAEQIIVELRDKMGTPVGDAAQSLITRGGINPHDEALIALLSLGYSENDALLALADVDPLLPIEERVKRALRN